jgi:hypothetical protein
MNILSYTPILHLEFDTQAELGLSMCRIQEFYESSNPELKGKRFSWHKFIEEHVDDQGRMSYFQDWSGFNFPVDAVWRFNQLKLADLSPAEQRIIHFVEYHPVKYIIGNVVGDIETAQHELVHAYYAINSEYRAKVNNLIRDHITNSISLYKQFVDAFEVMGYSDHVYNDEINAFVSCNEAAETLWVAVPDDVINKFVTLRKQYVPEVL